jgi:hypothetical protein
VDEDGRSFSGGHGKSFRRSRPLLNASSGRVSKTYWSWIDSHSGMSRVDDGPGCESGRRSSLRVGKVVGVDLDLRLVRYFVAAFLLEFDSYAVRYAAKGFPVSDPKEVSPHYPWSIAWRDGRIPPATSDFLEVAHDTATARAWREFDPGERTRAWLPPDDPVALELGLEFLADYVGSR